MMLYCIQISTYHILFQESDRSVRTTGAWEWRERDSSPSVGGGDWGGKLARRASHLDLRRRDGRPARRTSLYGSEVKINKKTPFLVSFMTW